MYSKVLFWVLGGRSTLLVPPKGLLERTRSIRENHKTLHQVHPEKGEEAALVLQAAQWGGLGSLHQGGDWGWQHRDAWGAQEQEAQSIGKSHGTAFSMLCKSFLPSFQTARLNRSVPEQLSQSRLGNSKSLQLKTSRQCLSSALNLSYTKMHSSHYSSQATPPLQPPPLSHTVCVKKLLPVPRYFHPALWASLCDQGTWEDRAGPVGSSTAKGLSSRCWSFSWPCLGHCQLLCVQSPADSRVCRKLYTDIWELGMFSPWQRAQERMEKNLMLFWAQRKLEKGKTILQR